MSRSDRDRIRPSRQRLSRETDEVAAGAGPRSNLRQTIGILLFVFTAGIPALERNGFGFGLKLGLPIYLFIAFIGGALGGTLMARDCWWAGLIGGAIAGPCGLLVLYWYVSGRNRVWKVELVIVQMLASLPGLGAYFLLRLLAPKPLPPREDWYEDEDDEDE